MDNNIVEALAAIEKILNKYDGVITDDIKNIRKDCAVLSPQDLQRKILEYAQGGKLLTIGIIGRVNSGKSSLLNAVFFNGENVLPKAATPMTAALTILSYGERFCAKVEYFSAADLANIKKEHDRYENLRLQVYDETKKELEAKKNIASDELEERIKRGVKKKMDELQIDNASYDQYERMLKSANPPHMCSGRTDIINAENLEELMRLMNDYVGSAGKFMPFTKSVEIHLAGKDYEALQNIRVVDTPGINDPVRSREQRTEEYLSECDVVFVVSPCERFITQDDMNLMDRLSSKEGVSQIFIVASKFDGGVMQANIIKDSKNKLPAAIKNLKQIFSKEAASAFKKLRKNSPEIAASKQFDQLIDEDAGRIIILAAMCYAMKLSFAKRSQWGEDESYQWKQFLKFYPDDFADEQRGKASLDLLANIDGIKEIIEQARLQKDSIILRKQQDYLTQQCANIKKYISGLKSTLEKKSEILKRSDLQEVQKQKQNLERRYSNCAAQIDDAFYECLEKFKHNIRSLARENAKKLVGDAAAHVGNIKGKDSWDEDVERPGLLNEIGRFLGSWGWEKRTHSIVVIEHPGAIKNIINNLIKDLGDKFEISITDTAAEWKKEMPRRIIAEYETAFADDPEDSSDQLRQAIRNVIHSLEIPNFNFSALPVFSNGRSGKIKGSDAVNEFIDEVTSYLGSLENKYCDITENTIGQIESSVRKNKISDLLFTDIKKQIDELEKNINNKESVLQKLDECLLELKGVNVNYGGK
jgi:predicted GTPase